MLSTNILIHKIYFTLDLLLFNTKSNREHLPLLIKSLYVYKSLAHSSVNIICEIFLACLQFEYLFFITSITERNLLAISEVLNVLDRSI